MIRRGLVLVAALAAGCADVLGPEVGPVRDDAGGGTGCAMVDSDPTTTVRFATDLLGGAFHRSNTDCLRCHTSGGAGVRDSGFDMTSYQTLRQGGVRSRGTIVVLGDPCASVLLQKLGPAPPFGARMPRSGPPFLDDADLRLVADWIIEGAHDN